MRTAVIFVTPGWPSSKESTCSAGAAGDTGSIPGLGRFPGEGNGNPLQYSCLERRAYRAIVHGVTRVGHNLATKPPPPLMGGTLADRRWYLWSPKACLWTMFLGRDVETPHICTCSPLMWAAKYRHRDLQSFLKMWKKKKKRTFNSGTQGSSAIHRVQLVQYKLQR